MNDNMIVQEEVEDMTEIELENGRLYLCDERGYIVGKSVAVQP